MALDFDALLRRLEHARSNRANWNTIWQDIADRVWPTMADFISKRTDGEQRTEKMLDSTATLAAQRALAAITSFFWPSNQRYQKLDEEDAPPDAKKTATNQAVAVYLDAQTEKLFKARYSTRAAFEAQMSEAGMSFLVFGTGILFIDDMLSDPSIARPGILYKSVPLSQAYLEENAAGKIDTLHRCWAWTLRQVEQRFPGKLPERLQRKLEKNPDEKIDIAQTVCPRQDYDPAGIGGINMPFASIYYIPGDKTILEEGGFRCWPFAIMRYMTATGEVYGRSPAWLAMSNIRTLNTMKRSSLAAAQRVADPTMLATEDGVLGVFAPGSTVYGGLNDNGEPMVKPLATGGDVGLTLEMMEKERDIISSAFFLDVFKALVENPQMTATQALELMQERATLMAPVGGRIEAEGLGPMTERELDILGHSGQLDPMPQELLRKGGAYKITYTSPMRRAMRASEGIAITRSLEQLLPLAQEDPSVLDVFQSLALVGHELCEINGVPAKLLNDLETIMALKAQRAQEANAAAAVQAAPQISAAARNLTQMQAAGGRPQV